jgi:hypothetical protein
VMSRSNTAAAPAPAIALCRDLASHRVGDAVARRDGNCRRC